jgi:putative nucleotidyltransferase with HDIG domain
MSHSAIVKKDGDTAPIKILLVDDDESFRPALQRTLEKLGYHVTPAVDGAEGKRLFSDGAFDLVVSDIRMPQVDGIELTRFIKESAKPVPMVLITGFSEILETVEAHEMGADAFLSKPIDRDELTGAIDRCLKRGGAEVKQDLEDMDVEDAFCRLGIEDFVSGRQILFSIFVRLSDTKYVKIAHKGEDLSIERVRSYRGKGVRFLYMRREDFRTYVGFNLTLTKVVRTAKGISREKKVNLIKHTGELLMEQIQHDGVDEELFDGAVVFVQTTIDVLCQDPDVFLLLDILNSHADHLYAHSVGVSLYSVMLARAVSWHLPTNKFKVAVGGILHDVGEKEIPRELLMRPRKDWSFTDLKLYESHPSRGVEILNQVRTIPSDVIQIVKEHHEDCIGNGFPARLKRSSIHPMAKMISVADSFCERIIKSPNQEGMTPSEALQQMAMLQSDRLDAQFLEALMRLFHFVPQVRSARAKRTETG